MGRPETRRRSVIALLALALLAVALDALVGHRTFVATDGGWQVSDAVDLPAPSTTGSVPLERTIAARRSRRAFGDAPLARAELGQLLWATQGVTAPESGFRSAPSAGALYPIEVYVVVGDPGVEDIAPGSYRYDPEGHTLATIESGNLQGRLRAAALDQDAVGRAAIDVVITAVDERTTRKYGDRGLRRYVPMEAGHAGENLYLQAEALGLSTVSIGAFDDDRVRTLIGAPADHRPLYVFPVGTRA